MTDRSRATLATLGLTGLGACVAAARTSADWLASGIIGLIALAFALGLVELWGRAGRARARRAAIRGDAPTDAPALAGWLDAHRHGEAPPMPVGLTPYLVGLLVMLGVLGTFLGLVDALGGAGDLVGRSGDLETLRADLAAPLGGLMRAFSTSLAGIGASACLGLALVVVRRAERAARSAFARFARRQLASETPAGRQQATLEQIASQGAALPDAARALTAVVARLESLDATLDAAFARSAEALQGTIGAGFEATRTQTQSALSELVAAATREAATAAGAELGKWSAAQAAAHADHLEAVEAALARAHAALAEQATQVAAAQADQVERLETAVAAINADHAAHLTQVRAAIAESQAAIATRGAAHVERVEAALSDAHAELTAQRARLVEAQAQQSAELTAARAAHTAELAEARAEQAREAGAVLTRLDAALEAHLSALGARLAGPLTQVAEASAEAPRAAAALVEQARAEWQEARAAGAGQRAQLDALIERMDALAAAHRTQAAAHETAQTERVDALIEKLGDAFSGQAEQLGATTKVVHEAADLLRAGGAELSAVAEMFADSVDGYRASSERWLEALGELQVVLGRSGEAEAGRLVGEYLDQTREVFGDAMRFQRELFTELRALRGGR